MISGKQINRSAGRLVLSLVLLYAIYSLTLKAGEPDTHSGFVQVEGGPVWYEIAGKDTNGIPLLTLHGGPGGTSCSLQVMNKLGDERPIIRYDQLGTGRSGRPRDAALWNRDRFVRALDTIRQELGLTEIHLMGHSWGGSLAAYYYLETGGKGVRSLILSSPLISTKKWTEDAMLLRQQLPQDIQNTLAKHEEAGTTDSTDYQQASDAFYELFVRRGVPVESHDCADAPWNPVIYNQMWGPTEFHATGSLMDFDLTARLSTIAVPTLFIAGEFDEARPETVASYAKLVKGAHFKVIPGVAHASYTRAPTLYRGVLRDFLNSVEQK